MHFGVVKGHPSGTDQRLEAVTGGRSMDHFCPSCGTTRIGAFRFCRSCRFDFDEPRVDPSDRPVGLPVVAAVQARALAAGRTTGRLTGQSLLNMGVLMLVGIAALGGIQRIDTGSPTSTESTAAATDRAAIAVVATPAPTNGVGRDPAVGSAGDDRPTAQSTPKPIAKAKPDRPDQPAETHRKGVFGNPWGYDFRPGSTIARPPARFCDYFKCVAAFWDGPAGYIAQCRDGSFTRAGGLDGACVDHRGVRRTLRRH